MAFVFYKPLTSKPSALADSGARQRGFASQLRRSKPSASADSRARQPRRSKPSAPADSKARQRGFASQPRRSKPSALADSGARQRGFAVEGSFKIPWKTNKIGDQLEMNRQQMLEKVENLSA